MTKLLTSVPKVQPNVVLVFGAALLTIALFATLIALSNRQTKKNEELVNHTYKINRQAEGIRSALAETELLTRQFVTDRDQRWLPALRSAWTGITQLADQTYSLAIDPAQREKMAGLKKLIAGKIASQQSIVNTFDSNTHSGHHGNDQQLTLSIQKVIGEFLQRQEELLKERILASNHARNRATATIIIGATLLFIFIAGSLLSLNNDIRRRKLVEEEIKTREAKYRRLIEEAGVTLFTSDNNGLFTYVNERCQQLTGFSQEELLGQSFTTLLLPSWIGQISAVYLQQVRDQSADLTVEFPILTKDGDIKWVEQHSVVLYSDQKNPIGYQCVVKDITEKRKQDEKIKESEFRFRTTLEKIGDNIWEHDFSTGRTQFPQTSHDLLGFQTHEFSNYADLWWSRIHEDDKWVLEENIRKYKSGIIDQHSEEYRMISCDGREKWVLDRGIVTDKMPDGTPIKILGTHTDITVLKDTQKELRESDLKIKAMLESSKDAFYLLDTDCKIILLNKAALRDLRIIAGKDCESGENMLDCISPVKKEIFQTLFQNALAGNTEEWEVMLNTLEGEKWFYINFFPVLNADNTVQAVSLSSKNITEHKLIEAALGKTRAGRA
ncbi:PAS domain S-box protein [Terrimonas pollutisoli]|uniref:PAS domain S-box protein n=1 Tax=Terrimonas pollutisoli TaxID=3034147 RepID=UPI0023EA9AB3|nr:PAS domain S-box protein [Terrimonas sp. H1YJ31]